MDKNKHRKGLSNGTPPTHARTNHAKILEEIKKRSNHKEDDKQRGKYRSKQIKIQLLNKPQGTHQQTKTMILRKTEHAWKIFMAKTGMIDAKTQQHLRMRKSTQRWQPKNNNGPNICQRPIKCQYNSQQTRQHYKHNQRMGNSVATP